MDDPPQAPPRRAEWMLGPMLPLILTAVVAVTCLLYLGAGAPAPQHGGTGPMRALAMPSSSAEAVNPLEPPSPSPLALASVTPTAAVHPTPSPAARLQGRPAPTSHAAPIANVATPDDREVTPIEPASPSSGKGQAETEKPQEYDVRPPAPDLAGDVAFPADGTLVSNAATRLTLRWQGTARAYRVEVFAGTSPVLAEPASSPSLSLPVTPGLRYRWRVSQLVDGNFRPLVAERSFQCVTSTIFNFDGADGAGGQTGVAAGPLDSGGHGDQGAAGGDAQDIKVTVEPAGDMVRIVLATPGGTQRLLVPKDAPPIKVSAVGGRGGDGGSGGNSGIGQFVRLPNGAVQPLPTEAGHGGRGGDGGHGGNITITARGGLEAHRYIVALTDGGAGGKGGQPGGGTLGNVTAVGGKPGHDGQPGAAGTVTFEEPAQ